MVDTVYERRQIAWRVGRDGALLRALISAGLLIGGIVGSVILAGSALAWHGSNMAALWIMFGLSLAWLLLRRFAAPKPRLGSEIGSTTVTHTERDGSVVHRDRRRHLRFVPARRATTLHLLDGRTFPAKVINLSIAGVAVETRMAEKDLIAVTQVGDHAAALIRQTPTGAVFGFDSMLDPRSLNAAFTL